MQIVDGRFLEGQKVSVLLENDKHIYRRIVRYNHMDGLYIIINNKKYFEYEVKYRYD